MKKRLFQVLDEMNVNDGVNKTATVGCCYDMVEAKTAKGGGHVTMGVPAEMIVKMLLGEVQPILLLLDKKEYHRLKDQPVDDKLSAAEQLIEQMAKALKEIKYKSLVVGQPGCTWGDTQYDSMSVAAGFNEALTECIRIADKALAGKGATLPEGINEKEVCTCSVQQLAAHGECENCPGRQTRYSNQTK